MTAALRFGCSGWSYKDWRGVVYPVELPHRERREGAGEARGRPRREDELGGIGEGASGAGRVLGSGAARGPLRADVEQPPAELPRPAALPGQSSGRLYRELRVPAEERDYEVALYEPHLFALLINSARPRFATSSIVSMDSAPGIQIGGCGRCWGLGQMFT